MIDKRTHKIFFTIAALAMTGAFASTFFYNYEEEGWTGQVFKSNAFAFTTGLVLVYTYFLYQD